ncbi:biotin/lipoyl-binding protein [Mariniblastus sp.]|jgi:hypothetical protein|nr:biotin/lipoyl-binding protein [Mariniblastus sp.]MDA7922953.1 biotin/lipoyl-binding protein [bacterium]MDA7925298.1 biotin/lipoyl-binding protein [Mariniblastus sp.]MDA7928784.1 biotin/lipoyl-binding protein [Mariniblastus sp.]MDB4386292.1 biotin/lipoyl-binding protein [bacterium]
MSTGEQQNNPSPSAIRDEVRRTVQQLNEMASTEKDFDQFCDTVLSRVVKITGAHGALLWQVNGNQTPQLTHQTGRHPNANAKDVLSQENSQHSNAVMEVVAKEQPMGLTSDSFTHPPDPQDENNGQRDESFLMLFSPVYNRTKKCCGTLELLQRGDISPQAQEGYLRFLSQISQLFQRWHEEQEEEQNHTVKTISADSWTNRLEFINETHRSINTVDTAYAIANEARRLLNCDRVSVGQWNGTKCKISAISSQDRFDNRSNVVRLLSAVATASVSAEATFWITGSTEGIAPEVAQKINDYLDESHSRTLIVIPLLARAPALPDLEMKSHQQQVSQKLGVLILEYFDADVPENEIEFDTQLIVGQSEIALENARKHSEIFLLPVWQRLGWLQQVLFRDHRAKTNTGLVALGILILVMLFFPKELKMKIDGVMHPATRNTIYAQTDGIIREILIDERAKVKKGQPLLRLENQDLEMQISSAEYEIQAINHQIDNANSQLASGLKDATESAEIGMAIDLFKKQRKTLSSKLKLMEFKRSQHEIVSPINGTVTTPRLKRRYTDFPAVSNLALLEVVDLEGQWQLELKIPQNKMTYVDQAFAEDPGKLLDVEFKIGTNPNLNLNGTLAKIAIDDRGVPSADGAPEFRAFVEIEPSQLAELQNELRSGAGATAKIRCGTRSLGFVCFYQIYDFLRTKVFF